MHRSVAEVTGNSFFPSRKIWKSVSTYNELRTQVISSYWDYPQEATLRRSSLSLTTAEFSSLTENDKSNN
jgi:hypothetical protein